jgi:hypothetical protein
MHGKELTPQSLARASVATPRARAHPAHDRIPVMPAALFELDDLATSPETRTGLDEIATDFISAMEKSGLQPDSVEYLRLWNLQQLIADTRFKARFGGAVWMKHHLASRSIPPP